MSNGKTLITTMDGRNVVLSVVQDRSKIQTLTPTVFKMTTTQQQPTAEKSVQTTDSNNSTTLVMTNTPITQIHTENATAEVANTLVSMATGRQRTATVKQLNVVTVPSNIPILSLAEYTTPHGVPTAMALANQAKLTSTQSEDMSVNDDETSMSTDDYNQNESTMKSRTKTTRGKLNKSLSGSKGARGQGIEPIQYGPILVKPRKSTAPTLANGRRSKDEPLPRDEDIKRQQRRERNKEAAAKCRRKRNDLREDLEKDEQILDGQRKSLESTVQSLLEQKNQLELLLHHHACAKARLPITTSKPIPTTTTTTTILDSNNNNGINNKRVTLNFTNAQDLLAIAPLTRITTTDGSSNSSSVPMITIHITPEVAQALLNSASVDKTKLAELLQQSNSSMTTQATADSNPSMNSTS